ncbi:MAG: hypothetical protein KJ893_10525 [Candidatus Omnitrophica bacterium]|nr:hypothetical protein [Candidatus Omnitrophota bacterium]MBU4477531.1 hypothetical protein [Candidatus Omnitrophota bacterium]
MKYLPLTLVALLFICYDASAYLEDYPPYKFKDGPPQYFQAETLVDLDKHEYRSNDGSVVVRLKKTDKGMDFLVKEAGFVLINENIKEYPTPYAVYRGDLDGNGLKDFIIFYWYGGCGLAVNWNKVEIFLKKQTDGYQKISYDTLASGLEDFVDLNNNGRYEVIIADIYSGGKHTYFAYNIYEFKDYKLVRADSKFNGFPKFIWFTHKPNDKDTTHLTEKERGEGKREGQRCLKF